MVVKTTRGVLVHERRVYECLADFVIDTHAVSVSPRPLDNLHGVLIVGFLVYHVTSEQWVVRQDFI